LGEGAVSAARTRVVVADDHPLYRHGIVDVLKRQPDLELVGEAGDGRAALAVLREHSPDVALLDVDMPHLNGLALLRAVTRDELGVRVLFLSGYFDSATVYEALQAGASGFLSKDATADSVCDAVRAVARGETVLGPEIQGALARELRERAPSVERPLLSAREREILALTAEGLTSPDIGRRLHLSPATVKTHLQNAYEKLGVSDRAAAVAEGMRRGLLE
jgi:two-component system, NarL family, nitrate/nitrite response regulator NarL